MTARSPTVDKGPSRIYSDWKSVSNQTEKVIGARKRPVRCNTTLFLIGASGAGSKKSLTRQPAPLKLTRESARQALTTANRFVNPK